MDARVLDGDLAAGRRLMARLEAFADFTDEPRRLTRLFLSEAHRRAALAFIGWCIETGFRGRATRPARWWLAMRDDGQARPLSCLARTSTPCATPGSTMAILARWRPLPS